MCMILTLRSFWNKIVMTLRVDVAVPPASARPSLQSASLQSAVGQASVAGFRAGTVPETPYATSILVGELPRLAMRWHTSARWPTETATHLAHSVRVRLRQQQAAQDWCESFFRARFSDLTRDELDQTRLLDCLDQKLINPGAFAASTYLPGDCRDVATNEARLDAASLLKALPALPALPAHAAIFKTEDAVWSMQAVRGLARQMLARIRRDTEHSSHTYGSAAKALLRLGPVMRSMDALQVETDPVYRRYAQSFLSTAPGGRLVQVLPLARNLPDVIAARVDDLSNAASRLHALQWVSRSSDPLAVQLTEAGQASVLLGIRRSAWDAACRLLLFPEGMISGSRSVGSQHMTSIAWHEADSTFDLSLTPEQQRQRTHTFAQDQTSYESHDQLHGSIAGYALSRLAPRMPAGRAAGLTQRWCRAWADLMTMCLPR